MHVLLSIKPEHAQAITQGKKSYELRKNLFRSGPVERVYLYVTKPVRKVIGSFKFGEIRCLQPRLLWEEIGTQSGISSLDFFEYFRGRDKGFAIKIEDLRLFETPIDPGLFIVDFRPPRSFIYIDGELSTLSTRPHTFRNSA